MQQDVQAGEVRIFVMTEMHVIPVASIDSWRFYKGRWGLATGTRSAPRSGARPLVAPMDWSLPCRHAFVVAVGLQSMNEPKLTFRDEYDVVHYGRGGLGWYALSCEGISQVRNDRIHRAEFEKPPTCVWCVAKESRA